LKFLLDMNLPRQLGRLMRDRGHDCRHAADLGLHLAEDHEIVEVARSAGEVILTHDLDFGRILAFSGTSEPSVIIFRQTSTRPEDLGETLERTMPLWAPSIPLGAVVVLEGRKVRVRRLPIRD
jgi:predicted nuclease of predicted toxin-antitoxin system